MKIMDKLSTYAALIGVVGAIGGGFYTWGQFNSRLDAIEKKPVVSLTALKQKDKELTKQFDEVLLYANEYKVDLIDRIAKVEEKIKPVDLTYVFKEIAKVREEMAMGKVDFTPVYKEIGKVKEQIAGLDIPEDVDLSSIYESISDIEKDLAIVQKENQVQDAMMEELKLKLKNPLGN